MRRLLSQSVLAVTALLCAAAPAAAQVKTVDPNQAIDSDLTPQSQQQAPQQAYPAQQQVQPQQTVPQGDYAPQNEQPSYQPQPYQTPPSQTAPGNGYAPQTGAPAQADNGAREQTTQSADTYDRDDLMSAAEGVFGKGAEGLAGILEKILKDQGRPNAYIAGREASGAFVVGLRYGSGLLYSKIEGQKPVYWTGPSVGFDVGGDANKVFVLVYNLYDSEDLFKRFPAGEGHLYFVGGFSASYLRSGNVVLIPVRLGVGWRAGVNVGYMKFSHHEKWLPF
ncbi:MAG: DUF1134 domain-containing protein [Sphingomonas sp.]